jgi:D-threo-aldose 1-dehydrogenase
MVGLERRHLGRTPLRVTVLGLGTGTLGGHRIPVTRKDGEAVIRAAWSAGVRYFDTAPFYGFGKACRILGDSLRDLPREDWVLSEKVGRLLRPQKNDGTPGALRHPLPFDDVFDYSYDGIMRSFDDSLQRMGLARITFSTRMTSARGSTAQRCIPRSCVGSARAGIVRWKNYAHRA